MEFSNERLEIIFRESLKQRPPVSSMLRVRFQMRVHASSCASLGSHSRFGSELTKEVNQRCIFEVCINARSSAILFSTPIFI